MRFFWPWIISGLFLVHAVKAQQPNPDSLKQVFTNASLADTLRFEAGLGYLMSQFRTDLDAARSTGHQLLDLAQTANDRKREATAHRLIGNTYAVQSRFAEARDAFFKSHSISLEIGDERGLATTNSNIGTVFYEMGNYLQAQAYLMEGLRLSEKLNLEAAISRALNNLGNLFVDQKNNEKALEYYLRSLELKEKMGDRRRLPAAYNNLGLVYTNMREHIKAVQSLDKSMEIARELGDIRGEARALSNLGVEYAKVGAFEAAIENYNQSIRLQNQVNDDDGLASSYSFRGKNYLQLKSWERARQDCMRSLAMAEKSGALNLQKESCDCIAKALEAQGNFRASLQYFQRYQALTDSLFNEQKTREITRTEMNYSFEKQQLADSVSFHKLQTAQQVAHEQDLSREHRKFFIVLIVSLLIIGFLAFLYWRHGQRLKMRRLENQVLNNEIEFKKKDLTNFAVNISNSLEWAESLAEKVDQIKEATGRKKAVEFEQLEKEIKNKVWVNEGSEDFYDKIDAFSSAFYHSLTSRFEELTKTEIRLCSLIRLDLNTKQIAVLQNINPASVKMSRNRLRKKLNLAPEDDLTAFLKSI